MTSADLNSEDSLNVTPQPVRITRPLIAPAVRSTGSSNAWMVTFTDLVALMLTFFVLLYSMSSLDVVQWQNLTGSLASSLDSVEETPVVEPKAQLDITQVRSVPGTDLDYLANVLSERLNSDEVLRDAGFVNQGDRLIVSLPDALVFKENTRELSENAERTMSALGGVFRSVSNSIEIVAYPIDDLALDAGGADKEAVWTQALGRAIHLARLLEETGYAGVIRPQGVAWSPETALSQAQPDDEGLASPEAAKHSIDIVLLDNAGER